VFTKFLGKTKNKPSFSKHWEMLNFWGENTHYFVLEEGNEMNE
jgi:hypothetical protein